MNVSAIIVTRGDVDVQPVLDSLPDEWEKILWDNHVGGPRVKVRSASGQFLDDRGADGPAIGDLAVYGRYAAIEYASHDLIYVQDDDCIVSDPQAIVSEWVACESLPGDHPGHPHGCHLVSNMPQQFRHDFYSDHALVGFGACFHRDSPKKAFDRFLEGRPFWPNETGYGIDKFFYWRTCDVVFTTLTPYVMVDVPKENLPWATDPSRMYHQPDHVGERTQMLELARRVRDQ